MHSYSLIEVCSIFVKKDIITIDGSNDTYQGNNNGSSLYYYCRLISNTCKWQFGRLCICCHKQHHEYGLTLAAPFSGLPEVSDKEDMPSPQKSHSKDADDFDWMIGEINNDISDVKILNVLREECNS